MTGYTLVAKSLWLKGPPARFGALDALIFDLDGTLIDARSAYRQAYLRALALYFDLVVKAAPPRWSPADLQFFKLRTRLNAAPDTMLALVYWSLWIHRTGSPLKVRDLPRLDRPGLAHLQTYLEERTAKPDCLWLSDHFRPTLAQELLQECYAGPQSASLYGQPPRYYHGPGFSEAETLLVRPELLHRQPRRYGIVTARSTTEARSSLARLGIALNPAYVVTADNAPPKPQLEALAAALHRLGDVANPLYIGDQLDDVAMVANWNQAGQVPPVLMAAVHPGLYDKRSRRLAIAEFRAAGVDVLAEDINTLLTWLPNSPVGR